MGIALFATGGSDSSVGLESVHDVCTSSADMSGRRDASRSTHSSIQDTQAADLALGCVSLGRCVHAFGDSSRVSRVLRVPSSSKSA